jgi:F-type H+-transporting ATPase subunit delta
LAGAMAGARKANRQECAMIDVVIAKRYGDAFVSSARKSIGLERILRDFKELKVIMQDNPGFAFFLHSPDISESQKKDFIDKVLGEDFSYDFKQFLKLLLAKRRIDKVLDIAEYVRLNYAHEGEAEAVLKTSFPLDLEVIQNIKDKLENRLNKKLKLFIDLDGGLLGGVRLVIGNTVVDGSLRRRLDELKEKLLTVRV